MRSVGNAKPLKRCVEEAVRVAEQLNQRNKENEALINRGEAALVSQIKQRAELALQEARNSYKQAYEEGDTDRVVSSQENLMRAQAEMSEAERYENNLAQSQAQREQQEQQFYQQRIANEAAQSVAQQQQPRQVDPGSPGLGQQKPLVYARWLRGDDKSRLRDSCLVNQERYTA